MKAMHTKSTALFSTLALASLIAVSAVTAQQLAGGGGDYDLSWNTIDGGGGTSTGGAFELAGTIGQHDAGVPLTGGTFELVGGFWPGAGGVPQPTCIGDISPQPNGDGMVNVSDLLFLIGNWGAAGDNPADLNNDNTVNVSDLLTLIGHWGLCP
jgi:hypothetical protein